MEIIGFILSILIGISLGLIGSGGSILTIPILVYILHVSPSDATTYSLFVVGTSALAGSFNGAKNKLLDYKIALYFGLPSVISIFLFLYFVKVASKSENIPSIVKYSSLLKSSISISLSSFFP